MRGMTSAGKKGRGLREKGHKDAKVRPSLKANYKRRNQISLPRYRWYYFQIILINHLKIQILIYLFIIFLYKKFI